MLVDNIIREVFSVPVEQSDARKVRVALDLLYALYCRYEDVWYQVNAVFPAMTKAEFDAYCALADQGF